jgi:ferritin-like metal-binding protein YciE
MPEMTTPRDLLIEELKDLYSAENQLIKALPKMAKAASTPKLKDAFETHLEQTRVHAQRLEQAAAALDESPKGKKCLAMEGLIKEGSEVMQEDASPGILDLALIGAAQKVEHYEIAGYGTARTLAELAGETKVAKLLQQTLDEEGKTDKLLTAIASVVSLEPDSEESEA